MTIALTRLVSTSPLARVAAAAAAAGVAAFALGLGLGQAGFALAVLDACWLFYAGLSAGSLALAAALRLAHGRWARPVVPIAEAAAGFMIPALGLLAVLLLGAQHLVPWAATSGAWGLGLLVLRQLVPSAVLVWLGRRLVRGAHRPGAEGRRGQADSVAYLLAYVVALSLWAYDWVLGLSRSPPATVVPAYYFVGAFLSGLAWVALVASLRGVAGPGLRHDVGKLLFAFAIVWAYLLWSLYLATWYGNLPEEVEPLLRRWQGGYRPVAAVVLLTVFVWPFWLLLSERTKRHRRTLGLGAAAILGGLLAERFLLVLPSLALEGGVGALLVGGGVAVGVAGLFVLSVETGRAAVRLAAPP
jgi:Ni/Fe-hydrogenase subunit HybB-like protein